MKIRVLGSAAGGGFPQWNCNCRNCHGVRTGSIRARPRTQSSIAVCGANEAAWVLINASPDILTQLQSARELQPARGIRDSAIVGIVLVDGQVDHTTGLFMLREATRPWKLWCTDSVYADLTSRNPVLRVLEHYCGVDRRRIDLAQPAFAVDGVPDLGFAAVPLHGKPAPYSPNRSAPLRGDNIALSIRTAGGRSVFYAPGLGAMDSATWEAMRAADCVLVDGTFWTDDEMITLRLSHKQARDIGHLPQDGAGGMLEWLDRLPQSTRKVLIHINNTNPILDEDSPQRARLVQHGVEVAGDGMEILV
ncbi:MAG TPA: pyrroloquinoline quinone biosynthesis protein PqqB [Povalibacter sp.]|nr:pyrroloquinoline quinone biosynthesis protein PqqB [Povalibacter sp.]